MDGPRYPRCLLPRLSRFTRDASCIERIVPGTKIATCRSHEVDVDPVVATERFVGLETLLDVLDAIFLGPDSAFTLNAGDLEGSPPFAIVTSDRGT